MTHVVRAGDGRLLLPRATVDTYLPGMPAAALVERDGEVYLLPLRGPTAGGLLLKQRNRDGDRVIVATELLEPRGLGRFSRDTEFHVRWVAEAGALLIEGLGAHRG